MFKPSKKILTYALIAIILLSTGFVIGVSSNGGDPTVDEYLGIFNFPWFNASEGFDAPNYYRNGQNYTEWIESISGGVTDHGALTGLTDDDHSLYLLQDGSEGLTGDWDIGDYNLTGKYIDFEDYYRLGENFTAWIESISGGVTDHGALTGLEDDDHSLYLLQDGSEGLTGDWDVGAYDITATDITADEFYRIGIGNYTAWVESLNGTPAHSKSFFIWESDSKYYSLDMFTNEVVSGTNASIITNWAIDNSSGPVFFSAGEYYYTGSILVQNFTRLIGAGKDLTILIQAGNHDLITATAAVQRVVIGNMKLQGAKGTYTGNGINIRNYLGRYEHIEVTYFSGSGVIVPDLGDPWAEYSALLELHDVSSNQNGAAGYLIKDPDVFMVNCFAYTNDINCEIWSSATKIVNPHFADAQTYNLKIYGAETEVTGGTLETSHTHSVYIRPFNGGPEAYAITFSGVNFARSDKLGTGTYYHIYAEGSLNYWVKNLAITGCNFYDDTGGYTDGAIFFNANVSSSSIVGNIFDDLSGRTVITINDASCFNNSILSNSFDSGSIPISDSGTGTNIGIRELERKLMSQFDFESKTNTAWLEQEACAITFNPNDYPGAEFYFESQLSNSAGGYTSYLGLFNNDDSQNVTSSQISTGGTSQPNIVRSGAITVGEGTGELHSGDHTYTFYYYLSDAGTMWFNQIRQIIIYPYGQNTLG